MKFDIAIIGGGIIGSSIAYFLARTGRAGRVTVIEPDSTYQLTATPQGAGGVRQLFSLPENIQMSRFSVDFYTKFAEIMAIDGEPAEINFQKQGYLFVVSEKGQSQLQANYQIQTDEGVQVELLDKSGLAARFPLLGLDDIAAGAYSPEDGWIDPNSALQGFRRKAQELGVTYIESRVINLDADNRAVKYADLENGTRLEADIFINAAGAWSTEIAAMLDVHLPIKPFCRLQHYWLCREEIEPLPLIKDESGLFFRPEGPNYVGGRPSWEIQPGFTFMSKDGRINEYFDDYFERVVWGLLRQRLPKFDAIKLERTWAGHYAQNMLDGNMILGATTLPNFYVATGFSGHGIMHAPAVGLALSELILEGQFSTMNLERMSYQRVIDNIPYKEKGII